MKNKNFFYQQYEKINWENQEKTKINSFVNNFIIQEIISKQNSSSIKIFDIGFGIGFFIKMIYKSLNPLYKNIIIGGCEPSEKNYNHFIKKSSNFRKGVELKTYNSTFLNTKTDEKFDFITAIYVFPHFVFDELEETAKKINLMLEPKGKFILVVANETYLKEKLESRKDLFIERNTFEFNGKKYKEILHYSNIPKIGKLIDFNREEQFYLDLFKKHGFKLGLKKDLDDNGFICTVFVFQKK
ncbi:MAG: class I SAM-dependent methyltransferase [Nanoarchaeota archaeon]